MAYSLLLLTTCGPSTGTGGEGDSGTTDETGDPTEFLWTFGGDDQPVLSWPVSDDAGNLFVLIGSGATKIEDGFRVDEIALASLSSHGEVRWITALGGPGESGRSGPVRPVVGPGGDVWAHHADELIRMSSDGDVLWRSPGIPRPYGYVSGDYTAITLAVASDGTCFILPFLMESGPEPLRQELRAIGSDGMERWRTEVGAAGSTGADFSKFPSETQSPLVAPDGDVLVGCDTCVQGQVGLVRVAASDGAPSIILSVPGEHMRYENVRWDGSATRLSFAGDDWRVFPDGSTETPEDDPPLFSSAGATLVPPNSVTPSGFSLRLGVQMLAVDVTGTPLEGLLARVSPVAVVEPLGVVVAVDVPGYPPRRGLLLVDSTGAVTLSRNDVFGEKEPVPVIGDGFIAYIEADTQRLVAVAAPVERVSGGVWPIIGGDPQGTRSAEGK